MLEPPAEDMDRTTSLGLWSYAQQFAEAGRKVAAGSGRTPPAPAYYLLGHSIELSLKGFLRGSGKTLEELKAIGHNLQAALNSANELDLESHCKLDEEDKAALARINAYYSRKELEYIVTGFRSLPVFDKLQRAADRLVSKLKEFCANNRDRHNGIEQFAPADEQKNTMPNRDFENFQRVLSGHSSSSLTIMGLTLTFLAAGFAGIYSIATTNSRINSDLWMVRLGIIMLMIMGILFVVWLREHALGAQAVAGLRKAGVKFPETPCWNGVTAKMWTFVFIVSILFWAVFIGFALLRC